MAKKESFVGIVNRNKSVRIPRAIRDTLKIVPGDYVLVTVEMRCEHAED